MKKFFTEIDAKDALLVSGIFMLGYGLFLVYPPACFIVIGSLFIAPSVLPMFATLRGAK